MNIFAFTELQPLPAYISVNQTGPDVAKVSVRTRGTESAAEAYITKADAVKLASRLLAWAGEAPQPDIAGMANRFLGWTLPHDFYPDAGIAFNPKPDARSTLNWPTGTNLLTYPQAVAMFDYCVTGKKP